MSEILVVDDERNARALLVRWLTAEGYTVSQAGDAISALAVMAQRTIAVVTVDKDMPGMDGTWLVEQIQEGHPATAMLLATGDDQIAPRVSLSRGVQGYLVKPLQRERVLQVVKDALVWHDSAAKQARPKAGEADPIDAWLQGRAGRPPKNE